MKTQEEYRRLLADVDGRLGELYRERRTIMEAFAEEYPAVLPPPRARTEHQQRVARCPRCSQRLDSSLAPAVETEEPTAVSVSLRS